jgi:transposase
MLTAEQNRSKRAAGSVRESVEQHVGSLRRLVKDVEERMAALVRADPAWRERDEILRSVPGIGPQTARTLEASLPELGHLNGKQLAKLVGVAPLNDDSGQYRGKRRVWGGRAGVRTTLYMAALAATRHNAVIRAYYQRLLAKGKAKKLALTACMRKLLTILNAMVKSKTHWRENLVDGG